MRSVVLFLLAAVLIGAAFEISRSESPEPAANGAKPPQAAAPAYPLPALGPTTSLLVVAPHPDDEVLCCAGVMQRVLHAGGRVTVVWITSGDASELDLLVIEKSLFVRPEKLRNLAGKRMLEARAAADSLGIARASQVFLGYPDRGVLAVLTDHYATPYFSRFNGASAVPYDGTLSRGQPYTGENLERDFESVLEKSQPTLILAPSPRDAHTDHEAAGILAMRVASRRGELNKLRYWIVHGGETWPLPRGYHPRLAQTSPPRGKGIPFSAFQLTPSEVEGKLAALQHYQTQMEVMSSFLQSYVRTTELFSEQPMPRP